MATQLVARGIQQLDKVLHDGGHIIRLRAGRLDQGRHGCDQRHAHGLWPLAAVDHGELHAGAFAQGGHAIRQSRCGQEHVLALVVRNESESLFRVEPTYAPTGHGTPRYSSDRQILDLLMNTSKYQFTSMHERTARGSAPDANHSLLCCRACRFSCLALLRSALRSALAS